MSNISKRNNRNPKYEYTFHVGQNLVCFPFVKSSDWRNNTESRYTVSEIFGDAGIVTEVIGEAKVAEFIGSSNEYPWIGSLTHVNPTKSYWVNNTSETSYNFSFTPNQFIPENVRYNLHLGINFLGFPGKNPINLSDAFSEDALNYVETITGEGEVAYLSNRSWTGNLNQLEPNKGYIIRGKNLQPAEPGVDPEIYQFQYVRVEDKPHTTEGAPSRGRYLIVVAEDTDLASFHTAYPSPAGRDWGQPVSGGGDETEILKRFSNGLLWGNNVGRRSSYEDYYSWPYSRRTHEKIVDENGNPQPDWGNFYPGTYGDLLVDGIIQTDNNYLEPLVNTDFIGYLKSRGFIVDVAVMDRRMRVLGNNDPEYTGAHPEDVPDLTVIPYVTEDWSQLRFTHPNLSHWEHVSGQTDGLGGNWSARLLNLHIQYFRNKYKGTDHPLTHVLLLGEPCSISSGRANSLQRGTQCIPMWETDSYSYNMTDVSDWGYTWFTNEYFKFRNIYLYGEDYNENDCSGWNCPNQEAFNIIMNGFNTYEDLLLLLENDIEGGPGEVDSLSYQSDYNRVSQWSEPSGDYTSEQFSYTTSIFSTDFNVGRISTKEPTDYQSRQGYLMNQIQHTIGYHNFQHLYLTNVKQCISTEGLWTAEGAQGVCAGTDTPCTISNEDAIWAGCGNSVLGHQQFWCEAPSLDCSNWDAIDYHKEYLGNSYHIGYNYAGAG
tara:strand:+ start:2459 stop:4591 length:2133 start_codon:yes stop_codon:yes gene_type:complete